MNITEESGKELDALSPSAAELTLIEDVIFPHHQVAPHVVLLALREFVDARVKKALQDEARLREQYPLRHQIVIDTHGRRPVGFFRPLEPVVDEPGKQVRGRGCVLED